jgi:hypothetical protein
MEVDPEVRPISPREESTFCEEVLTGCGGSIALGVDTACESALVDAKGLFEDAVETGWSTL